jgi:hypothetical protein
MRLRTFITIGMLMVIVGCAGYQRGCSSWNAQAFGSNWVVVQYDMTLTPKCAWVLHNTSISNEDGSDGIYWLDSETGHLIHISGWYNRVQVTGNRFKQAAKLVGVDLQYVQNGKYPAEQPQDVEKE